MYKGKRWSSSKKVVIDGIKFDSKAEGEYYKILKDLKETGQIEDFENQVRFSLPDMDGGNRFSYTCDFIVTKLGGEKVYLEVKGRMMPGNKLRYAYWQYVYEEKLIIIPTNGPSALNISWI